MPKTAVMLKARHLFVGALSCAALGLIYAGKASATPPLSLDVKDRIVAVNDSAIYLHREVSDNMGRHAARRSVSYIIKLDQNSGALLGFHEVEKAVESEGAVTDFTRTGFKPNAYFHRENATPVFTIYRARPKEGRDMWSGYSKPEASQILERVNTALEPVLTHYIGPIPEQSNLEIHMVSPRYERATDCEVTHIETLTFWPSGPGAKEGAAQAMAALSCPPPDYDGGDYHDVSAQIYIPLSPSGP